jgi:hypothetical protein
VVNLSRPNGHENWLLIPLLKHIILAHGQRAKLSAGTLAPQFVIRTSDEWNRPSASSSESPLGQAPERLCAVIQGPATAKLI